MCHTLEVLLQLEKIPITKRTIEILLLVMIRLISMTICLLMGHGFTMPRMGMSGFLRFTDTDGDPIRMETGHGLIPVGSGYRIGNGGGFPFTTADGDGTIIWAGTGFPIQHGGLLG